LLEEKWGKWDLIWFIVGRSARRRPGFKRSFFPISQRLAPKLKYISRYAELSLPISGQSPDESFREARGG